MAIYTRELQAKIIRGSYRLILQKHTQELQAILWLEPKFGVLNGFLPKY
jgi:hypothetical protein